MLKLRKNVFVLIALTIGIVFLAMACDQGGGKTSSGCGEVKEVIVQMPTTEETQGEIDNFEVEIIDAVTLDSLAQIEASPGQAKAVSIVDTGAPITVKATAYDDAGVKIGEGSSTNTFSVEYNGMLCDMTVGMDMVSPINPVSATVDITVDCHIADIIKKMVDFATDVFNDTVEVWKYIVQDVKEDITNIIDIYR